MAGPAQPHNAPCPHGVRAGAARGGRAGAAPRAPARARCAQRRGVPRSRPRCATAGPAGPAASGGAAAGPAGSGGAARPAAPWSLMFDLRERDTEWSDANKARLVGITAAAELGLPWPEMQSRLDALAVLMPDIGSRIASLRPALVAPLVRDLDQLPGAAAAAAAGARDELRPRATWAPWCAVSTTPWAQHPGARMHARASATCTPLCSPGRMIALRELLPGANIGALVASSPQVLLKSEAQLAAAVAELKRLLDVDDGQLAW